MITPCSPWPTSVPDPARHLECNAFCGDGLHCVLYHGDPEDEPLVDCWWQLEFRGIYTVRYEAAAEHGPCQAPDGWRHWVVWFWWHGDRPYRLANLDAQFPPDTVIPVCSDETGTWQTAIRPQAKCVRVAPLGTDGQPIGPWRDLPVAGPIEITYTRWENPDP